jgi:hypothetical protein
LQNSCQNYFELLFLVIFWLFYNLKKSKYYSLLTVWYALRPIQQPTVSLNYSQSIKINIGTSDGGMIIPSTHCPTLLYWRLSDFKTLCTDSETCIKIYMPWNFFYKTIKGSFFPESTDVFVISSNTRTFYIIFKAALNCVFFTIYTSILSNLKTSSISKQILVAKIQIFQLRKKRFIRMFEEMTNASVLSEKSYI